MLLCLQPIHYKPHIQYLLLDVTVHRLYLLAICKIPVSRVLAYFWRIFAENCRGFRRIRWFFWVFTNPIFPRQLTFSIFSSFLPGECLQTMLLNKQRASIGWIKNVNHRYLDWRWRCFDRLERLVKGNICDALEKKCSYLCKFKRICAILNGSVQAPTDLRKCDWQSFYSSLSRSVRLEMPLCNRRLTLFNLWTSQKVRYYGLMMWEGRGKGGAGRFGRFRPPSLLVPNFLPRP